MSLFLQSKYALLQKYKTNRKNAFTDKQKELWDKRIARLEQSITFLISQDKIKEMMEK